MQGTVVKEVEHNYMSEMGGNIRQYARPDRFW